MKATREHAAEKACDATMRSIEYPEHVHACSGGHGTDGNHKCSGGDCRRWFFPGAST